MSTRPAPRSYIGELLPRIVGPEVEDLPPEATRVLLAVKLPEQDQRRVHDFIAKNQEGKLMEPRKNKLSKLVLHVAAALAIF